MDVKELLARYAAGERSFVGVRLGLVSLNRVDLSNIDLSNAILHSVNLIGTNLSNADLSNADLWRVNLVDAKLCGAKLCGTKLRGIRLMSADLRNADLRGADLFIADLTEADLSGAKWDSLSEAKWDSLSGDKLKGLILTYQKNLEQLTERATALEVRLEKQKLIQDVLLASNQGTNAPYQWNGFYFRSKTEIKIAEALDKAGVLFYPNCKARLSSSVCREGKETDFLVFYQGKWGILEVDGEPWHPPSRTVHDHERDRLFKVHGIRIVEHYDSTPCEKQPDRVVREFLEILRQA